MTTTGFPEDTPNPLRLMAELEFLNELCRVVASTNELQPILDWIVQKTTAMFRAEEGSIRLLGQDSDTPMLKTLVRKEAPGISSGSWPQVISTNVMGFLMTKNEPLATEDLLNDARFPGLKNAQTRIRSVLAVPLLVDNQFMGMLAVTHSTPGRRWKQDEAALLSIVASNSANVIERAKLRISAETARRLEEEARRLEQELTLAREIQMNLVPSLPLRLGGWEACGRVVPARQVGGDSFDYFALGDRRLGMAIGDVSGKGVPAAILMSNVQASLRAFCNGRGSITDAVRSLNESVVRGAQGGKFVTFFYSELDVSTGMLHYTNAGHNYPLVRRRDGTLLELEAGGLPLGIVERGYDLGEVRLEPGDSLLLYSDGITEALDGRGREFGDDRLRDFWRQRGAGAPTQMVDAIMKEVEVFRGPALQSDDMTLVVLAHDGSA
jgi:phosphoserine phosphatase RsbU/P